MAKYSIDDMDTFHSFIYNKCEFIVKRCDINKEIFMLCNICNNFFQFIVILIPKGEVTSLPHSCIFNRIFYYKIFYTLYISQRHRYIFRYYTNIIIPPEFINAHTELNIIHNSDTTDKELRRAKYNLSWHIPEKIRIYYDLLCIFPKELVLHILSLDLLIAAK